MKKLTFFIILSCWSWLAESQLAAAPMGVNTGAANSSNFQSVVFAGQAGRGLAGRVNFIVKNKCFGTNLRSVANPLSPLSTIVLRVGVVDLTGNIATYTVKYPASSVTASGSGQAMELDASQVSNNNIFGSLVGNVLRFQTPLITVSSVDTKGDLTYKRSGTIASINFLQEFNPKTLDGQPPYPLYGAYSTRLCAICQSNSGSETYLKRALPFRNSLEAKNYFLQYPLKTSPVANFSAYNAAYQKWYNWFLPAMLTLRAQTTYAGPYMGLPGPLSAQMNIFNSKDGKTIEISAAFPGQEGYCGGYHSPLMVFFDDHRPKFTATVSFPINPSGKTMWPEANSSGSFIAYDRLGDGRITRADELFGNSEKFVNGFEALRKFDSNHDNVVDNQDLEFDKLLLWHDENGDGFSQPGELTRLKDKIKSISLNYSNKEITSFGSRAEVREKSSFIYWSNGQEKKGDVLDIWFSPEK